MGNTGEWVCVTLRSCRNLPEGFLSPSSLVAASKGREGSRVLIGASLSNRPEGSIPWVIMFLKYQRAGGTKAVGFCGGELPCGS